MRSRYFATREPEATCWPGWGSGYTCTMNHMLQEWVTLNCICSGEMWSLCCGDLRSPGEPAIAPTFKYTQNWCKLVQLHEACSQRAPGSLGSQRPPLIL